MAWAGLTRQASLFGGSDPGFDPAFEARRRLVLSHGAWIDHVPGWVRGHEAVFESLWLTTRWRQERRRMYERVVDVPRLVATLPEDGPGHPLLPALAEALSTRYGRPLRQISLAGYRDGRDSVAFHGDRFVRDRDDTVVAIVSLGARRRFLLRPAGGGPSRALALGEGDLLVMGGTCQRTWEHGVPKVAAAGPRLSVQFRSHRDLPPPPNPPSPPVDGLRPLAGGGGSRARSVAAPPVSGPPGGGAASGGSGGPPRTPAGRTA
jgi:alkylated DNA repair dioxygenase AlkB